jgi:hypothetical protein
MSSERSLSSGFPTKILYAFLVSSMRATCPAQYHPLRFYTSNNIWRIRNSSSSKYI